MSSENDTLLFLSPSARPPSTSPSDHSISTPERTHFPRGTSSRSTFHGAQLHERRSATYNGPPASPNMCHEIGNLAPARRGTSTGIISKITSKFSRRYVVPAVRHGLCDKQQLFPIILLFLFIFHSEYNRIVKNKTF